MEYTVEQTDKHADLRETAPVFEPLPGEYHVVEVDHLGREIPGSDFSIPPKQYERTYKRFPRFIVKKNQF